MIDGILIGAAMLAAATDLLTAALGISTDEANDLIEEESLKILEALESEAPP
jgi:hypothetical protein